MAALPEYRYRTHNSIEKQQQQKLKHRLRA